MRQSITVLPEDILLAVCDHLDPQRAIGITTVARLERHQQAGFLDWRGRGSEFRAFSMTCRSLRKLCLPFMFRVCVLHAKMVDKVVPQSVSVFTRRLYIHQVQMTPSHFRDFLRAMPNVREAYVSYSPHLLPTLLETASLEVFALRRVPMSQPLALFANVSAPLRTLRLLPEPHLSFLDKPAEQILAETEWLKSLLPLVRPTLEQLYLPAESTRLSCLCLDTRRDVPPGYPPRPRLAAAYRVSRGPLVS
ncbi:hypothetical protein AURDEDRAFT_165643 [Auricularia subglabra TFB-10046 SS5]|nr:hypothetical protein AURDEDRAFT_165643 [Auricularia subglabra TFB-10046 SS5]